MDYMPLLIICRLLKKGLCRFAQARRAQAMQNPVRGRSGAKSPSAASEARGASSCGSSSHGAGDLRVFWLDVHCQECLLEMQNAKQFCKAVCHFGRRCGFWQPYLVVGSFGVARSSMPSSPRGDGPRQSLGNRDRTQGSFGGPSGIHRAGGSSRHCGWLQGQILWTASRRT